MLIIRHRADMRFLWLVEDLTSHSKLAISSYNIWWVGLCSKDIFGLFLIQVTQAGVNIMQEYRAPSVGTNLAYAIKSVWTAWRRWSWLTKTSLMRKSRYDSNKLGISKDSWENIGFWMLQGLFKFSFIRSISAKDWCWYRLEGHCLIWSKSLYNKL